jgi:branched-chain amino acid transport system ATP-binding protein
MSVLQIDGINTFYGNSHVLQDLSLRVEKGEVVALLGRNGAGKTTTIRSVMGLTPPRSGEIRFKNQPLSNLEPHAISNLGIGYVPEGRNVFSRLSVRENIEIVADQGTAWPIDRLFDLFPHLKERQENKASQLSGGEQQMLAMARALATDPELLLLDEPSEGLAPVIVQDLQDLLADLIDTDVTILLTEQNTNFAFSISERAYVLNKGQIEWDGTIDDLKQNEELVDTYLSVASSE